MWWHCLPSAFLYNACWFVPMTAGAAFFNYIDTGRLHRRTHTIGYMTQVASLFF